MSATRGLGRTNCGYLILRFVIRTRNYGVSSTTILAMSLRALAEVVGLIVATRRAGSAYGGQRLPTLYRLTDEPSHEMPAKYMDLEGLT
jgi:hypothetical protein